MRALWRVGLAALMALAHAAGSAGEPLRPLFSSSDVLHVTIRGPIPRLSDGPDHLTDGALIVDGATPETLPIRIGLRGITRRQRDVCQFPPLRIEFPGKAADSSPFRGQKRLKLVTHCRASPAFQQYVLLEYAAYRMINAVTPLSYHVRLATIDYVNAKGDPMTSRLGFFIEDTRDIARRNDLWESQMPDRVAITQLSPRDSARVALLQYMIGNLDWAVNAGPAGAGCCHNARLIGVKDQMIGLVPLIYDFDFSGLVDAPYATPPEKVRVPNVRTRMFRGFCAHNGEVKGAVADIVSKRTAIFAALDDVPQLREALRQRAAAYLLGFFDSVSSDKGVQAKLIAACIN